MVTIPKTRRYRGHTYTLYRAFVSEGEANTIIKKLHEAGKSAHKFQKAGEMHVVRSYHVYAR